MKTPSVDAVARELVEQLASLRADFLVANFEPSRYQLEDKILGQNPLPGRQWATVMNELRGCYFRLQYLLIDCDEAKKEKRSVNSFKRRRAAVREEELLYEISRVIKETKKLVGIATKLPSSTCAELEFEEQEHHIMLAKLEEMAAQASQFSNISTERIQKLVRKGMAKLAPVEFANGKRVVGLFSPALQADVKPDDRVRRVQNARDRIRALRNELPSVETPLAQEAKAKTNGN